MEEWRNIEGFAPYQVSNLGQVRRKGWILKKYPNHNGYERVELSCNGARRFIFVQCIVAKAFPEICGEWFEGAQVNHKNEIKTDNRAVNLEVCTAKYNCNYGCRNEKISKWHTDNNFGGRKVQQIAKDGTIIKEYKSISTAAKETGIAEALIGKCCRGYIDQRGCRYKSAGGYNWQYI